MEYSKLAASEPNVKLGSNDTLKSGSCDWKVSDVGWSAGAGSELDSGTLPFFLSC